MRYPRTLVLGLVLASSPAFSANYDKHAAEAYTSGSAGYTVYVDVTFGMRKRVAASELNDAHKAFSDRGFEPVSVTDHIENGDLLGFFVTYRRKAG
ncbi:hypothetical protein [Arenimonas daejeonensis]|uniref:hypothetical protein n=1 Tax=Arenimonas daejeonensis TaxID=370777 RepID=UPI0011BD9413|nr:hypothetical protein [Arenimonas daejeonensis]